MTDPTGDNLGVQAVTVSTTDTGWFKAVSPEFLSLLGRPVESLTGVNFFDLVHPSGVASLRAMLAAGGTEPGPLPGRLLTAGDTWTPVDLTLHVAGDHFVWAITATPASAPTFVEEETPVPAKAVPAGAPGGTTPVQDVLAEDTAADQPQHQATPLTGDLIPGDEIPDLRAAVRASVAQGAPMLEIDADGRTVFVSGSWDDLSSEGATGVEVFEELVVGSGHADELLARLDATIQTSEPGKLELARPGRPPRWIQFLPIPSPHIAGVVHALISVVPGSQLADPVAVPVGSPIESLRPTLPASAPEPLAESASEAEPEAAEVATEVLVEQDSTETSSDAVAPAAAVAAAAVAAAAVAAAPKPDALDAGFRFRHLRSAPIELLDAPAGRSAKVLAALAALFTYLAVHGLYLGPAYDWPSPFDGLLNSQECLIEPLCDNNVLRFNHLAVISLVVAVALFAVLFRRVGPRRLVSERPETAVDLAPTSWRPTRRGPGAVAWLAVIAIAVISVQTLAGGTATTWLWIAATALGAIAAWRSDRDAAVRLDGTMAALGLAMACLLVPLGIGSIWLGERMLHGIVLLAVGLALFAFAMRLNASSDSSFDHLDYIAMLGLSVLALVLGLARHRSWRYAFIGDEWSFYEGAVDGLRGIPRLGTFDIGGPNNYFTGLTFELQSSVMQVAGDDVWGWRLSSLMPMVLSVAAMYAFTRWLSGRTAALVAAVALAAGHMLLSFSMVGYNNSQSLVAVSASFAALAWAHQRPSALRFFILGSAVGSTFLVYAMARLALLPIGLLFLVLFRNDLASFRRRLGWSALGGVAMAAPALFSGQNWEALLKATPVEAEDPVLAAGGVPRQVLENTLEGWLSFIGNRHNSHFIVGPHLDVISAILVIVGLGFAIARARRNPALGAFLIGGFGLWTAINAIQQYAQISNTRSFMIPLVYCVFIGIGASALFPLMLQRVRNLKPTTAVGAAAFFGFALVLVALNQWHIGSHANERQQLTEQAVLLQQFEQTESSDGQGMQVHVGWPEINNGRINMVLTAHDVAPERIVVIPTEGALNIDRLCAETDPAMLVMHRNHPKAVEWTESLASCWQTPAVEVTDPAGALKLYRVANSTGLQEFDRAAGDRVNQAASTGDYSVTDSMDIAIDGSGVAYALSRSVDGAKIHRLDGGGSFDLIQNQPVDFDITADGLFVVAANGGDDRLVWYDGRGSVVNRYAGQDELPQIGGVTVEGNQLWFSDVTRSRLLGTDANFKIAEIRFANGSLVEPGSLAPGPDGSVWAFSSRTGEIVLVDANDQPTTRLPARVFNPADTPRLSSTASGWLIRTVPERPIVELVSPTGEVIDARGGTFRPRAAASRAGELVVSDPRWGDVRVIGVDEQWTPRSHGTVAWGQRSLGTNAAGELDSPFAVDQLADGGVVPMELTESEPVQVGEGQTWRLTGAPIMGEALAIAATGDVVLVGDVNGRVVVLDADGAGTSVIAVPGSGSTFISDMAGDGGGGAWLLDAGQGRIHRVEADGSARTLEPQNDALRNARGVGLAPDGSLWAASTAAAQLTQVLADGTAGAVVPLPGRQPSDVVALADDTFWIVDSQEIELVRVNASGETLATVPMDVFTSIHSPHFAVVDNTLWVTDPEASAAFRVDLTTNQPIGEPVQLMRGDGSRIDKPVGISAGSDGRIWIADSLGGATTVLDAG
jgi:hypothetical protein